MLYYSMGGMNMYFFKKILLFSILISIFGCSQSLEAQYSSRLNVFEISAPSNLCILSCYYVENNGIFDQLESYYSASFLDKDVSLIKHFSTEHMSAFKDVWEKHRKYYIEGSTSRIPDAYLPNFEEEGLKYLYACKSELSEKNSKIEFFDDPYLGPKSVSEGGWIVVASLTMVFSESENKLFSFFSALP